MRIATFNVENLDDAPVTGNDLKYDAPFEERAPLLRAQLERLRADVLCLQEVHGQDDPADPANDDGPRTLRALNTLLSGTSYADHRMVWTVTTKDEPYKVRNLVTLVAPEIQISAHRQIKHDHAPAPFYDYSTDEPDGEAKKITWERPLLYTRLTPPDGRPLHVVNAHFKSKLPTSVKGQMIDRHTWRTTGGWAEGFFVSSMKRVGAAIETRMFLDTLFAAEPEARIVLCGDLNAGPDEVPIQALRGEVADTQNPALHPFTMYPCENTVPEDARFTLYHHGRKNLLDHMLMSRALIAAYRSAEIHNELVRDESVAYASDRKFPTSDHAPIVVDFDLPPAAMA